MGFSNQTLAYFSARDGLIPYAETSTLAISQPATTSASANSAFPKAKKPGMLSHVVGRRSQASSGV